MAQPSLFDPAPVLGTTRTVPAGTITYRSHQDAYHDLRRAFTDLAREIAEAHVKGTVSLPPKVLAAFTRASTVAATPIATPPIHTGVPDNGTATSKRAAEKISTRAGSMQTRVLKAIVDAGGIGATDEELERKLYMKHQTLSARRRALVLAGLVHANGVRNGQTIWCSTPGGVLHLSSVIPATPPATAAPAAPPAGP